MNELEYSYCFQRVAPAAENGATSLGVQSLSSTYKTRARRNIIRTLATVSTAFFLCFVWNQVTVCLSCLSVCMPAGAQKSCEKVMFSVVSVCLYVHRRVPTVQSPGPTRQASSNLFKPFHYEVRTLAFYFLLSCLWAVTTCVMSVCHFTFSSLYLSACLSVCLSDKISENIYWSGYLSSFFCRSLSLKLYFCLSVCLFVRMFIYLADNLVLKVRIAAQRQIE